MAPRKSVADKKAKEATDAKESNDKVIKRPARGFHRFKNGMLNVTPKGQEKDMVATNGGSPLLALPPEIRNRIFRYALGGKTFRQVHRTYYRHPFQCEPSERLHAFALLRTCRQIYVETASVPLVLNRFSTDRRYELRKACRGRFTKYQLSHITELQAEVFHAYPDPGYDYGLAGVLSNSNLSILPNLRRVRILVFPSGKIVWDEQALARYESKCRLQYADEIRSGNYELVFELMDMTWGEFNMKWSGTPEAEAEASTPDWSSDSSEV